MQRTAKSSINTRGTWGEFSLSCIRNSAGTESFVIWCFVLFLFAWHLSTHLWQNAVESRPVNYSNHSVTFGSLKRGECNTDPLRIDQNNFCTHSGQQNRRCNTDGGSSLRHLWCPDRGSGWSGGTSWIVSRNVASESEDRGALASA